jgi:hypothetical protein
MQNLPDRSAFSENLASTFILQHQGGESTELELIELKTGHSTPHMEQFSLTFRGPGQTLLPQQIYQVQHNRLGAFDLFLVPVGHDGHGSYYEAVFNRYIDR